MDLTDLSQDQQKEVAPVERRELNKHSQKGSGVTKRNGKYTKKGGDPRGHSEGVPEGGRQRSIGEDLSPESVLKLSGSIVMQVQDPQGQAEIDRNTRLSSTGDHRTSMKGDISAGKTAAIALGSPKSPVQLQVLFCSQQKIHQLLVP